MPLPALVTAPTDAPATTEHPNATKKEYAARCRFSVRNLEGLIADGLPVYRVGARVIIPIADADAWIRQRYLVKSRPSGWKPRRNPAPVSKTAA